MWAGSVSLTPMLRLRMFSVPSRPVQTPSYMPTFFTGQLFFLRRTRALEDTSSESDRLESPVALQLVRGSAIGTQPGRLASAGGITKEIRPLYGPTRLRLFGGLETRATWLPSYLQGRQWLEGWGEYLFGPRRDELSPVRLHLESGLSLDAVNCLGAFLRFYSGQDYYNLGFTTDFTVLQAGIVFSASPAQGLGLARFSR